MLSQSFMELSFAESIGPHPASVQGLLLRKAMHVKAKNVWAGYSAAGCHRVRFIRGRKKVPLAVALGVRVHADVQVIFAIVG